MDGDERAVPVEATQALRIVRHCLSDTLATAYLHGSAVAGGLHQGSDVDVLVVVEWPTTHAVPMRLTAEFMKVSGRHSARSS